MPGIRGIHIGVVCDNAALNEYSVTEEDQRTVSCFIASEAGKTFGISINNTLSDAGISTRVLLDGVSMEHYFCRPSYSGICGGVIINENELRPYQFSVIETTDDDTVAKRHDPLAQKLGMIEIRVCRSHKTGDSEVTPRTVPTFGLVHERSKKAGNHRVSLGNRILEPQSRAHVRFVESYEDPYAIFRFYYKPREILMAQDIIPCPSRAKKQITGTSSRTQVSNSGPPTHASYSTGKGRIRKRQREDTSTDEDSDSGIELLSDPEDADPELVSMKEQISALQKRLNRRMQTKRKGRKIKREHSNDAVSLEEPAIIDLTTD